MELLLLANFTTIHHVLEMMVREWAIIIIHVVGVVFIRSCNFNGKKYEIVVQVKIEPLDRPDEQKGRPSVVTKSKRNVKKTNDKNLQNSTTPGLSTETKIQTTKKIKKFSYTPQLPTLMSLTVLAIKLLKDALLLLVWTATGRPCDCDRVLCLFGSSSSS